MSQTNTNTKNTSIVHEPVLRKEVIDNLSPARGERYLDLTAGYGGHASVILEHTRSECVLVDRDDKAISVLRKQFGGHGNIRLIHSDFLSACKLLHETGEKFDVILADVGMSSPHLDNPERGFSLKSEGPLDMRMDRSISLTAQEVVNSYDLDRLVKLLRDYGEEPKAASMAKAIIAARPLTSTTQLAEIAKSVWPGYSKVHPATRLFQAIRIEVNDELGQLEQALPIAASLLKEGGRFGVISFHSLEDRIVKQTFRDLTDGEYTSDYRLATKKPVTASQDEIVFNPRARSSKLRVLQAKIKKERGVA